MKLFYVELRRGGGPRHASRQGHTVAHWERPISRTTARRRKTDAFRSVLWNVAYERLWLGIKGGVWSCVCFGSRGGPTGIYFFTPFLKQLTPIDDYLDIFHCVEEVQIAISHASSGKPTNIGTDTLVKKVLSPVSKIFESMISKDKDELLVLLLCSSGIHQSAQTYHT